MAGETAALLGKPAAVKSGAVVTTDPNPVRYGQLTGEVADVIRLFARTEGVLVDPVYTAPALLGLIDLIRQGQFRRDANVVFVHTGGTAALFSYVDSLAAEFDRVERT
jgi:1-aminocyclopropane-1-carboxylate deaminase/D-cysteine desulfhydrase-like pyridoxal-dependent ACC family enzyme